MSQSLKGGGKRVVRSPGLVVGICDFGQLNVEVWRASCYFKQCSGNSLEESKTFLLQ